MPIEMTVEEKERTAKTLRAKQLRAKRDSVQEERGVIEQMQRPAAASRSAIMSVAEEGGKIQQEIPLRTYVAEELGDPHPFGALGRKVQGIILRNDDKDKTIKQLADEERLLIPGSKESREDMGRMVGAAKQGFQNGLLSPETIPTFQELARQATIEDQEVRGLPEGKAQISMNAVEEFGASGGGFILDQLTDPLVLALGFTGLGAKMVLTRMASTPKGLAQLTKLAETVSKIPGAKTAKKVLFGDIFSLFKKKPATPDLTALKDATIKTNKLVRQNEIVENQVKNINNQIDSLVNKRNLANERVANQVFNQATKKAEAAGRLYGKRLDAIASQTEATIKKSDFTGFIDDFSRVMETGEDGLQLPRTRTMAIIRREARKFRPKKIESKLLGVKGEKLQPTIEDEVMDLRKDLINFKRNVNKSLPRNLDPTERMVAHEFTAAYGNFLESKGVNGLKELNSSYAPVIQNLRKAQKAFSQGKGKAVIARTSAGEATKADQELLGLITKGDDKFVKGTGDLLSEPRELANRIRILQENDPTTAGKNVDLIVAKVKAMDEELAGLTRMTESDEVLKSGMNLIEATKRINRINRNKLILRNTIKWLAYYGAYKIVESGFRRAISGSGFSED